MPDLEGCDSIWEAWRDAGYALPDRALPWSEVDAFARLNGVPGDVAVMIRRMSLAYVEGLALTSPLSISPMEAAEG